MGIIYVPSGKAREYAQLAANLYEGCDHRCTYCFGPSTLKKKPEIFHSVNQPKKDALIRFEKEAIKFGKAGDDREILLSFVTDPYQAIESDLNITRQAIKILIENNLRFTILTKGGIRAARDFDLLKNYNRASFGTTICFTKQDVADKWEPNASTIDMRIAAIKAAHEMGIRTWVSLEPVIDPDQALELIEQIHPFVDHWKVGKLNYQSLEVDWLKFREEVTSLLVSKGADYYLKKSLTDLKEPKKQRKPKSVPATVVENDNAIKTEDSDPWTEGVIPTRKGTCNILVIAPHGHSSDDKGTYPLARKLADELDCYAVVNEKYRKPKNMKPNEKYEKAYLIDLNHWPAIRSSKEAITDFEGPIINFKQQLLKKYGSLFILNIHGIGDDNRDLVAELLPEFKENPGDLHLLIGYGQHRNDNSLETADIDMLVKPLIAELHKVGVKSAIAPTQHIIDKNGEKQWYCGNHEEKLNQKLCNPRNKVKSLQLEFKKSGFRNNTENINNKAIKLANAVRAVWKIDIPAESQNLPVAAASEPDLNKVYNNLMAIFSKGFENTMFEAGRYLIKTFYGGDCKIAKEDKKRRSLNSLNQYILELREQNPGAPGKSWIYNAVNLVIDHETIKAYSEKLFHTYGILPLSHKVLLFPVKDMSTKQDLIEYADQNHPTVLEFKKRIAGSKSSESLKTQSGPSLLKIIANPEKIFAKEISKLITAKALKQLPSPTLEKLQSKAKDSVVKIEENIKMEKNHIKRYKKLIEVIINTSQKEPEEPSPVIPKPKKSHNSR